MTVDEMNAKYGKPAVNVSAPTGPSELESAWGMAPTNTEPTLTSKLSERLGNVKRAFSTADTNISNIANDANGGLISDTEGAVLSATEGGRVPLRVAGQAGGAVMDVAEAGLKKAGENIAPLIKNDPTIDLTKKAVGKLKDFVAPHLAEPVNKAAEAWKKFSEENPNLAQDLGDIGNMFNLVGLGEGAVPALKGAGTVLKDTPELVGNVVKGAGKVKNPLSGVGLSKTPEEILATPESQAHKLSPVEREYYKNAQKENLSKQFAEQGSLSDKEFAAKQAQLEAEHNAITTRTNTELASKTAQAEKDIASLSKEVEQTAYNKTLELKPKAIQALGNQSKTYRSLIEEDLSPHRNTPVTSQEISDVINNALPDNPGMAEKIKGQVGKSKNIGELYESVKGVKADTSKAGLRGNRVYTADDMARDKVVGGLSDLMKEKGVDLSRANDFWRQWAPLRDKIVTKLKPFDTAGMETKTFSEILKSSGDDIHNQNFIKAFENVLGEPITGETQAALARLSAAQKAKVAAEVDAKMAIEEAKLAKKYGMESIAGEKSATGEALKSAKSTAEQTLKEKQFQIDRLAARKQAIKTAIKTIAGTLAVPAVGFPIYNAVTGH